MKREEEQIQKALFTWFQYQYPKHIRHFQASLNGIHAQSANSKRDIDKKKAKGIAARKIKNLKDQGMCVGQSDIFIALARRNFHGLYLELKILDGGATKSQMQFGQDMTDEGYLFAVAKGLDAAKRQIRDYIGER